MKMFSPLKSNVIRFLVVALLLSCAGLQDVHLVAQAAAPTPMPAVVNSVTFYSQPGKVGWILESAHNSRVGGALNAMSTTLVVGDDALNRQYRDILSFNTASLPDTAVVKSAVLYLMQAGKVVGSNPFITLGSLAIDVKSPFFGATPGVGLEDFSAPASARIAYFNKTPSGGWYTATLNATGRSKINTTGLTQMRLTLTTNTNNNSKADYIRFFSGDATTDKPSLVITYIVP